MHLLLVFHCVEDCPSSSVWQHVTLVFLSFFLLLLQQCSSVPVNRVTCYQWFPCTSRNFNGNSLYIETMLVVSLHVDSIDTIQCMTRDVSSQYIFMAAMAKG